jgi:peroxiredoxin
LVAISPQLEKYGHSVHRRLNLGFDVLSDRGLQVASQFGLVFVLPDYLKTIYLQFGSKLDEFHGENVFRLPMPARYVIDQQSVIRSADVTPDYTVRPDPSETISALEQVTKTGANSRQR